MCEAKENKEKKQIEKSGNYMVLGSPKHTVKKLQKTEVGIFNWKEKKSLIMELVERPESEERAVVFCWRDWRVAPVDGETLSCKSEKERGRGGLEVFQEAG